MKEDTLMEFSVTPLGSGESVSTPIAEVIEKVRESGLDHRIEAMGTIVEGNLEECLQLVRDAAREALSHSPRTLIDVKLDVRPGHRGRIRQNVESVEAKTT